MGLLEQISQMRKENMSNEEITLRLQEQGASPRAINDAFNQEKIKSAVSSEGRETLEDYSPQVPAIPQRSFYQPKTQEADDYSQNYYTPQEMTSPQEYYAGPPAQAQYSGYPESQQIPEEYYPAEQGYEGEYSEAYGAYTADTIIEIAEQVFSEKIKRFERQIEKFNEFSTLADTKISNNIERIKRMEAIIDKLQIAILEKIGSYGKNLENIKKEMEMIEDSFSKMLPELHKRNSEHKKISKKSSKKE
jgi:hypothetical protein